MNRLKRDEFLFGASVTFGSVRSTEVMARVGFDYIMGDAQHGHYDKTSATDAIRAIVSTPTVPIARVAHNDPGRINDMLDAGAWGVVVPMVNGPEDARAAAAAAFYPPKGARSRAGGLRPYYGADYYTAANDEVMLIVMIETPEAVEQCEQILAVSGIDACLIGSGDLTLTMNCGRDSEELGLAVDRITRAGRANGVPIGLSVVSVEEASLWSRRDILFVLSTNEMNLLNQAAHDFVGSMKQALRQ